MSNAERLPPYEKFVDEFGRGFITDTYSVVSESNGYEKVFATSLANVREESGGYGDWSSWQKGAKAGSVTAQYLELIWAIHRDHFWSWRFDDG
jgi:hypothetical protein